MKCDRCGTDVTNIQYFKDKYGDEVICEDCMLEIDGITTDTVTNYFLDGEFIGDNNELDVVINNICYCCDFEEIKRDKEKFIKELIEGCGENPIGLESELDKVEKEDKDEN